MSTGRALALAGAVIIIALWAAIVWTPYNTILWFDKAPIKIILVTISGLSIVLIGLILHRLTYIPSAKRMVVGGSGTFTVGLFAGILYPAGIATINITPQTIYLTMADYEATTAWVTISCGILLFLMILLFAMMRIFEVLNDCEL